MLHLCPKCKSATLAPLSETSTVPRSEAGPVPPSRCTSCHGVWMPHGALSLELGLPRHDPKSPPPPPPSVTHDAKVGFCPAGHGLLIRARVDTDEPFHLDRCGTCAGIWFDPGEWARLASTEWMHHVDKLWDPVYRKRLREQKARAQHLEALSQALGEETAKKVVELAAALRTNPHRSLAMAYLIDEVKEGGEP